MIIDISHHQNPQNMNYDRLSEQVDFVIIRTQYGSSLIDRYYKIHHEEFRKRGVPTASYAWVRGRSIADMEKEATDFYNRTVDLAPTFWFLDVEEKSMNDMRSGVSAYVNKLKELGAHKVGIYIAHHLYKEFNLKLEEADAIWIPHYGINNGLPNSRPNYPCDIHQYTSVGKLAGYNGNLDLNRILSDKPLSYFTKDTKETDKNQPSTWASEAWIWAKNKGLMDGTRPKDPATREEIAVILKRFSEKLKS
jgi:GH25 family lysozyme M1 (1,4-beta-N-acetylmuramidase)